MEEVSAEQLASQLYQEGVSNFENGNYQKSIALLERARALAVVETTLGGEILIWLANAYDAVGKTEEAIAICRGLRFIFGNQLLAQRLYSPQATETKQESSSEAILRLTVQAGHLKKQRRDIVRASCSSNQRCNGARQVLAGLLGRHQYRSK